MKTFYFTATGNSLAAAKRIGGELISIAKADEKVYRDDAIGIVFPTYGFSVPKVVRRFLAETTLEADYLFAVATYGSTGGAVTRDVRRLLDFDYVNSILTVDNFLPIFDTAKQKAKLPSKNTAERIERVAEDIRNRKRFVPECGIGGKFLTAVCSKINIEMPDFPRKFFRVEGCVRCGICAKVCPVGNIEVKDAPVFSANCACCLACAHACPEKAIHVKGERSAERWRNPEVSLEEIIRANNQKERI
ncbi:MAG: EFR1 family ferrodoxin [Abditibacteriota bacterium]|nr:EFR1 family ferrodoxin [Abditibacteriota bacterium]MBP5092729.1 EFR1 family ferrodoxin [Abditibacteriota bacterium]